MSIRLFCASDGVFVLTLQQIRKAIFPAVSLRSSLNVPACRTDQKSEVLRYLRVGICVCRPMRVPQYG